MTNDRYAGGREEDAPEMAIGDGASRKRNRAWTLCENVLERSRGIHGRRIPGNQLAAGADLRGYGLARSTHVE